jgi:hypothetical protein
LTPVPGTVTVGTGTQNGICSITVRDIGIGIADDDLQHVFDRFWRSDQARSHPGHGFGLSLVKQIIQAHDGGITLTAGAQDSPATSSSSSVESGATSADTDNVQNEVEDGTDDGEAADETGTKSTTESGTESGTENTSDDMNGVAVEDGTKD